MRDRNGSCKNIPNDPHDIRQNSTTVLEFMSSHKKLIAFIFIAIFGVLLWYYTVQQNKQEKYQTLANDFTNLRDASYSQKPQKDILLMSKTLSNEISDSGYVAMSKLVQAGTLAKNLDKNCLQIFREVAYDKKLSRIFSDYAYAMYVHASLDILSVDEMHQQIPGMIKHIEILIESNSPWSDYLFLSLSYCYLYQEDYIKAIQTLEGIRDSSTSLIDKDMIHALLNYARTKQIKQNRTKNQATAKDNSSLSTKASSAPDKTTKIRH